MPLAHGVFCRKAIFNCDMSEWCDFFSLWFLWSVTSMAESSLFQYHKVSVQFYAGIFCVLGGRSLVFTSAGV